MIVTWPVFHLIDADNFHLLPGVEAWEYRDLEAATLPGGLPALFHSTLGIVQDEFMEWFDRQADTLTRRRFRMLSFDCGPAVRQPVVEDYYYVGQGEAPSRGALQDLIRDRVAVLRRRFAGTLAVENLNYFPTAAYRHVCEADFISDVVRQNELGLILDVAHAIVTAHNLGVEVLDYLLALPLDRVCGVHLSAAGRVGRTWRDLHGSPTAGEYALLDRLGPYLPGDVYVVVEQYASWDAMVKDYRALIRYCRQRTQVGEGAGHTTGL